MAGLPDIGNVKQVDKKFFVVGVDAAVAYAHKTDIFFFRPVAVVDFFPITFKKISQRGPCLRVVAKRDLRRNEMAFSQENKFQFANGVEEKNNRESNDEPQEGVACANHKANRRHDPECCGTG